MPFLHCDDDMQETSAKIVEARVHFSRGIQKRAKHVFNLLRYIAKNLVNYHFGRQQPATRSNKIKTPQTNSALSDRKTKDQHKWFT